MSSNFNNAKIINVYYNKGDRKPYDVNGKPIAYIGEEAIGATEATTIRFYLGEDLDSSTAVIVTKRPDGERRLDLCEKIGTGVNSYYQVTLNAWYGAVKGKATLAFKVYNGEVEFDDEETPTEIISVEGRIVVSDIFNLEIAYAPEADLIVPADDTPDYVEWFAALSTKLDKAQSITVTGALPTLTGDVYDDRYFYVENEGTGRLYYINGSTAIEVVWQVGTLRLTPTGNGELTADTGKLSWNQPNGTVNVGLYNDVNVGVGEDVFYYVKATGAITKGDVIQYAGYQGDHALAKRAVQSEVNANPKLIMGIAKQNITNGDFGYVAHFGKIEGVDTKGVAVNSFVWFDSAGSTAGNWTTTQPTAPNAKILLAVIIKAETNANANNGVFLVRPTIESKLSDLQGINISSVSNRQILRYNSTFQSWENSSALTIAENNIDDLIGRIDTEETNVDNLQGRMTSAEGDIDDIESGATIVPKALGDQLGRTINTTYLTQSSASATYIPLSQKAQANGVATLGTDGRIPASQIPGVVTSIEEYDTLEDFPEVGVLTTVYLALDTGLTYLWSGSQYVALSSSLALGETSTTAYRGDRGKIAYDYSQVGHLPLAGGTVTGNLVVGGDLTISGTTTTINTETVGIKDNLILINSNQTGTPSTALKGGLEIERGDLTNFQFVFDESDDRFKVGQVGSLQTVATRTDDGTIANRGITFFNTSTNRLENNANIVIDSSDNVGIGNNNPQAKLDVSGSVTLGKGSNNHLTTISGFGVLSSGNRLGNYGQILLNANTEFTTSARRWLITNALNPGAGTFSIIKSTDADTTPTIGEGGTVTGGEAVFLIDRFNNVGIGTTSPQAKLQVEGNIISTGSSNKSFSVQSGTNNYAYFGTFSDFALIGVNRNPSTGDFADLNKASADIGLLGANGDSAIIFGTTTTNGGLPSERMRITGGGRVLIGSTNGVGDDFFSIKWNSSTVGQGSNMIDTNASANGSTFMVFRKNDDTYLGNIRRSATDNAMFVGGNSYLALGSENTERMRITSGGNVGIGTTNPGSKLYVDGPMGTNYVGIFNNTTTSGNVYGIGSSLGTNANNTTSWHFVGVTADINAWFLYGNGTTSYSSDRRLKKNIETTRDGYLEDLMKLRVVKYNWHNSEDGTPRELGLIAQEVEEVFPGLIQEHEMKNVGVRKNIKHSVMEFIVIKAIQELKQEVETLKEELELLKAKVG
jgi:hypothetical protein